MLPILIFSSHLVKILSVSEELICEAITSANMAVPPSPEKIGLLVTELVGRRCWSCQLGLVGYFDLIETPTSTSDFNRTKIGNLCSSRSWRRFWLSWFGWPWIFSVLFTLLFIPFPTAFPTVKERRGNDHYQHHSHHRHYYYYLLFAIVRRERMKRNGVMFIRRRMESKSRWGATEN